MADDSSVADGLMKIFENRQSFIVIGLTGRTGSGCSTIAKILNKSKFSEIRKLGINSSHDTDQEKRKERIIRDWLGYEHNWSRFRIIQVSNVLLMIAVSASHVELMDFIKEKLADVSQSRTFAAHLQIIDDLTGQYHPKCLETRNTLQKLATLGAVTQKDIDTAFDFFDNDLPNFALKIRDQFEKINSHVYTKVFQAFGDNVRSSGNPLSDAVAPEALLSLPATVARIIKLCRLRSKKPNDARDYFVIDALRHPFEIRFLRERFAPFYVMAVTTNDADRKLRLGTKLLPDEIVELDRKEYPSETGQSRDTYRDLVSQDIQACLELADVYISNPGTSKSVDTRKTAQQVLRYVALMQRPGLVTPSHIERCMQTAFSAKLNSGCISRQVGASVTDKNYSIKAIGWNDVPQGQVPCLLRNTYHLLEGTDEGAYSEYEKDEKFVGRLRELNPRGLSCTHVMGRNNTFCFKSIHNKINQVHTRSLHAEENAFLQLTKYGSPGICGGNLFTTASPCELCAKKAYQLGIKQIYYIDPYPGISNNHILRSGSQQPTVTLFSGAVGRAYHDPYEPLMPLKDELARIASQDPLNQGYEALYSGAVTQAQHIAQGLQAANSSDECQSAITAIEELLLTVKRLSETTSSAD